jgi:hypothetical protein
VGLSHPKNAANPAEVLARSDARVGTTMVEKRANKSHVRSARNRARCGEWRESMILCIRRPIAAS